MSYVYLKNISHLKYFVLVASVFVYLFDMVL